MIQQKTSLVLVFRVTFLGVLLLQVLVTIFSTQHSLVVAVEAFIVTCATNRLRSSPASSSSSSGIFITSVLRKSSCPNSELQSLSSSLGELCGLSYQEPVYRPPAEWRSLILQVTIGCSWNKCTFCEMYQDKTFKARPIEDIITELDRIVDANGAPHVRDVFLADGDAMTLPTGHLDQILDAIAERLPSVRRVSSYCLPRNIRGKSWQALENLRSKGLSLVYVGCESGDDTVLPAVQKGESYQSSLDALQKLEKAGIKHSVMILLGLGGKEHSSRHALSLALLLSETKPEYLSVLTTSFPRGKQRVEAGYVQNCGSNEPFEELRAREILTELEMFLDAVDIPHDGKTIFRSDHASNYLVLKGRLGRDKNRILRDIRGVLDAPPEDDHYNLRPELARGL